MDIIADFDPAKFRLGTLCKRNHDWNGTGQSLRYQHGDCIECAIARTITWQKVNSDRVREKQRKYCIVNHDKILQRSRNYRKANLEKLKEYGRTYYKANPLSRIKKLAGTRKRRALKKQCHTAHYNPADIKALEAKFNHRCAYCGTDSQKLTIDHFIPMSKGGSDCLGNFVIACGSCNYSKNNHDALEWYERQPFYSKKRWNFILKVLGKQKVNHNQLPLF